MDLQQFWVYSAAIYKIWKREKLFLKIEKKLITIFSNIFENIFEKYRKNLKNKFGKWNWKKNEENIENILEKQKWVHMTSKKDIE